MASGVGAFSRLHQEFKAGRVSRRAFMAKATALGVGLPVALFVANATRGSVATAQDTTDSTRPTVATDNQQRGAGGELRILQWQAAASLSIHAASGGADIAAASLVTEPLLSYAPDGTLLPNLVTEVPSFENGGLATDLSRVTYQLLPDVVWSDGEPFTAEDVVFTWQWIIDPANLSIDATTFSIIDRVEALDPLTVEVIFSEPTLGWYIPFTSTNRGGIYPKHFWDGADQQAANDAFHTTPIGTGPYVVEDFIPNDQVIYIANERYREPTKPFFERVNLKGGGDAASAARAVLQMGDWDFADNVQVDPNLLAEMEAAGNGTVYGAPGTYLEKIQLNLSNPNEEVEGQRSHKDTAHPFLADPAVRRALSLATDRETVSRELYEGAPNEPAGRNILTGIAAYESPNTEWEFNLDLAEQVLEEAGWTWDGDVRSKEGVELRLTYATTINDLRQKTQAVNKQHWEAVGFNVQLRQIDGGIFFDSSAGNDQSFTHFYTDLQLYTDGPTSTFPLAYMQYWYAGPDGANIAQRENGWTGTNKNRYQNPEYDAIYEQIARETDPEQAAALFVQLNDIVINDAVEIPLVQRIARKFAATNSLRYENFAASAFETIYWNIANWNLRDD